MKKISVWFSILTLATSLATAQDTATQQQIDKLTGQIQDLLEAQAHQGKKIDALERELAELREKVNTPVVSDSAKAEDLRKLAEKVQEVDQKRQDDHEVIVKQIEQLGKAIANTPASSSGSGRKTTSSKNPEPEVSQNGYYYEVRPGDSLGLIIKAYRDKGVKVTKAQVIAANPKINPDVLIPGKRIFIPDPSAK